MKKNFTLLSVMLSLMLLNIGLVYAGSNFDNALGVWTSVWERTNGGTMKSRTTFKENGRMVYYPGGSVDFHTAGDDGKWEGMWVESSAPKRCDVPHANGSHYWGIVLFQFSENYTEFEGSWDYCGEGKKECGPVNVMIKEKCYRSLSLRF
jgi:hypothetical protein